MPTWKKRKGNFPKLIRERSVQPGRRRLKMGRQTNGKHFKRDEINISGGSVQDEASV
jgi:hypothetical protein